MAKDYLKELQIVYKPFALFWEYWKHYAYNTLNEHDIYLIEVHAKNNFLKDVDHLLQYYSNSREIEKVIFKLKGSYAEYQNWVITRFQSYLVTLLYDNTNDLCLGIEQNTLTERHSLKRLLSLLHVKTIQGFIEKITCEQLKEPDLFSSVEDFTFQSIRLFDTVRLIETNLKKEVAAMNGY